MFFVAPSRNCVFWKAVTVQWASALLLMWNNLCHYVLVYCNIECTPNAALIAQSFMCITTLECTPNAALVVQSIVCVLFSQFGVYAERCSYCVIIMCHYYNMCESFVCIIFSWTFLIFFCGLFVYEIGKSAYKGCPFWGPVCKGWIFMLRIIHVMNM